MSRGWMPMYWGDYLADTGHLTMREHGAYLLLLAHYYQTGRPLPTNAEQLHFICRARTKADKTAVARILSEFFHMLDEKFVHRRCDKELIKANELSEKRRVAASNRQQLQSNSSAHAHQLDTQSQSHTQSHKARSKPSAKSAEPDSRLRPLAEFITHCQKHAQVPEQFDARCAKTLSVWLLANRQVTIDAAKELIRNRFRSDLPRGEPPWKWLPHLSSYAEGPLDKFNRLQGVSHEQSGKNTANVARNLERLSRIADLADAPNGRMSGDVVSGGDTGANANAAPEGVAGNGRPSGAASIRAGDSDGDANAEILPPARGHRGTG